MEVARRHARVWLAMSIESLVEYSILVPDAMNNGAALDKGQRESLESMLLDLFGGFTRVSDLFGAWKDASGKVWADAITEYRLGVPDTEGSLSAIRMAATTIGHDLSQQAVYITCPGGKAEILSTV